MSSAKARRRYAIEVSPVTVNEPVTALLPAAGMLLTLRRRGPAGIEPQD